MLTRSGVIRGFLALMFTALLAAPIPVAAQIPMPARPAPAAETPQPNVDESVPVVVWNREITRLRANLQGLTAAQRAERAANRILAIPAGLAEYHIEARSAALGDTSSVVIFVNGMLTVWLLEQDVDVDAGETLASASARASENLKAWLASRDEQMHWPTVVRGLGWALGATLIAILGLMLLVWVARRLLSRFESLRDPSSRPFRLGEFDVRPYLLALATGTIRLLAIGAAAAVLYLWLTFVLNQFPYTRPWGQQLGRFIADVLRELGLGLVRSIPNLFVVVVIYFGTRLLSRFATAFFRSAESQWIEVEVARATRRLVVGLLWVFALIVAYPYLPGSDTAAFQGISVFIGLVVSLGSSGVVSQMLGGLVVVYTRAFSVGDYVRIGDHEGTVAEIGALAAKIVTLRKEEVTIPYSVLSSSTTTNYSRQLRVSGTGARVATQVAIGYDAPWRQVEAMLQGAAARTSNVLRDPPPLVLKNNLSDFAVEYQLIVSIPRAEVRYLMLSELHANILDAFNEHGVQIMTPHFEGQPEGTVLVPRDRWFAAPARTETTAQGLEKPGSPPNSG